MKVCTCKNKCKQNPKGGKQKLKGKKAKLSIKHKWNCCSQKQRLSFHPRYKPGQQMQCCTIFFPFRKWNKIIGSWKSLSSSRWQMMNILPNCRHNNSDQVLKLDLQSVSEMQHSRSQVWQSNYTFCKIKQGKQKVIL